MIDIDRLKALDQRWNDTHHPDGEFICREDLHDFLRNSVPSIIDMADRLTRYEAALDQIELLSCNQGGWFEQDGYGEYGRLGDIARQARGDTQ